MLKNNIFLLDPEWAAVFTESATIAGVATLTSVQNPRSQRENPAMKTLNY